MNISVNRAELLKAVVNVSKAINSASVSAVPVLGKILFSVEGDTLSVKAPTKTPPFQSRSNLTLLMAIVLSSLRQVQSRKSYQTLRQSR